MLMFATAAGAAGLVAARVVQGLTTGAALSAVGAAMIDLNKARGTMANAVAPPFGSALGGIIAGFFVQFLPGPTHLVYAALAAVFVAQSVGLTLMKEPITPRPGVWQSLTPQLALPAAAREPLLLALPVLIAVWALGGLYACLGPMLVRAMLGSNEPLLGGLVAICAGRERRRGRIAAAESRGAPDDGARRGRVWALASASSCGR